MDIEAIKSELRSLSRQERRKLLAFLVMLDDEEREGYADVLAQRIDNKALERWVTAEQCETMLGLTDGSK